MRAAGLGSSAGMALKKITNYYTYIKGKKPGPWDRKDFLQ
jgi:hypothetical protein